MQTSPTLTDPTKRHDVVLLFDVTTGNPNGDPDAGNLPRVDPETMHGLVTDVCLKRKIRDYVATVHGEGIFIRSEATLNSLISQGFNDAGVQLPAMPVQDEALVEWFRGKELPDFVFDGDASLTYSGESGNVRDIQSSLLEQLGDDEREALTPKMRDLARNLSNLRKGRGITPGDRQRAREQLCTDYYDIRMFGAVLQTGLNAGQVRGPFQLTFARSVDPISPLDLTITRQARTTAVRLETGATEMGRKPIVPYGLYRCHGYFNPFLAQQTGVTAQDLERLWGAMADMFTFDRSAARGEMIVQGLYVFSHPNGLGNAPAHRLFDLIDVPPSEAEAPRSFRDYRVVIDQAGVPERVTLTRLVG